MDNIELNGNFIICEKTERKMSFAKNFLICNKEEVPLFKIVEKHLDDRIEFPFEVGDIVFSASTGTPIVYKGKKIWIFQAEHILAKII